MFRVGQPIECIDVRGSSCLRRKQVYTCLAIEPEYLGVDCCACSDRTSHRWFTYRFRPLVARKTDIAALKALLNPSLEDLRAIVRENANA